jgi:rhomboid family protein
MERITPIVKNLIIINVIFFLATEIMLRTSGIDLNQMLALYYFENSHFHLWQYITYMFMHGGVMHILFNMYALWAFGTPLEKIWGAQKFLFFYFSCGIGAALLHTGVNYYYFHQGLNALTAKGIPEEMIRSLFDKGQYLQVWKEVITVSDFNNMASSYIVSTVGASGAIYGILVAFGFMFPDAALMLIFFPVPIKAKYFIPILVGLDLFSGVTGVSLFGGNIAHFAHVGGALIGFVIMWYWRKGNSIDNNQFRYS